MGPAIKKKLDRKCFHDKNKYWCKECGGGGICVHNKSKYWCKECGGSGICPHGKRKDCCADCQNFVCPVPACKGRRLSSARNLQGHIEFWHSNKCCHMEPLYYFGGFCPECTKCQQSGRRDPRCVSLAEAV